MTESIEEISIELAALESRLTPANAKQVWTYILNSTSNMTWSFVHEAFGDGEKPFGKAFLLHELEELEEFRRLGLEFVNVPQSEELQRKREEAYDNNPQPHLNATKLHCRYFQLLARKAGYNLSLGTCIEYDPISSVQDKMRLVEQDPSLKVNPEEVEYAMKFFGDLVKDDKLILSSPISFGTFNNYREYIRI